MATKRYRYVGVWGTDSPYSFRILDRESSIRVVSAFHSLHCAYYI